MDKHYLIRELISDTQEIVTTVEDTFSALDKVQLYTRPAPNRWSVLECIEHMNIANAHYISQFDVKLPAAKPTMNANEFKPGLMGNYFVKMIKPKSDGRIPSPMKTMKKFIPEMKLNDNTIRNFLADQQSILKALELSKRLDLNKIKITSAIGPIVTFKLGDAFRFLIGHNQRHVIQAKKVLENL
tara:strand:+ start:165 stop:719 length:555 start_codon:yes stop_codon:yes gene_type:complete